MGEAAAEAADHLREASHGLAARRAPPWMAIRPLPPPAIAPATPCADTKDARAAAR